MTQRIAAVVVTFNRKALLLECLAGLLAQSRPVDRIFLIDNASTDGTREALEGAGFLSHPLIEYVPMATNTGGAGGFHHGLKVAFEAGYDWFWLMDDDVEPLPGGLADLLSFSERSGCIHGRRREADGSPNVWGETFDPRRVLTRPIADPLFTAGQESQAISVACFEGMLIAREVVERIGYPDASFFIALDDTYYGYLASRVTPVLYVNRFVLQRKRAAAAVVEEPVAVACQRPLQHPPVDRVPRSRNSAITFEVADDDPDGLGREQGDAGQLGTREAGIRAQHREHDELGGRDSKPCQRAFHRQPRRRLRLA